MIYVTTRKLVKLKKKNQYMNLEWKRFRLLIGYNTIIHLLEITSSILHKDLTKIKIYILQNAHLENTYINTNKYLK